MTTTYQVLPDLTPAEYDALRDDIREHGVMIPIEVDEHGSILDGHHRKKICDELGIDAPTITRRGMTESEKHDHALKLNLQRRHLTSAQKREIIEAELRRDWGRSDRSIAKLVGVDHKTVGAVRQFRKVQAEAHARWMHEIVDHIVIAGMEFREVMHALYNHPAKPKDLSQKSIAELYEVHFGDLDRDTPSWVPIESRDSFLKASEAPDDDAALEILNAAVKATFLAYGDWADQHPAEREKYEKYRAGDDGEIPQPCECPWHVAIRQSEDAEQAA